MILTSPALGIFELLPSRHLDVSGSSLTLTSLRSRTSNDILHRALAHINYRAFDVRRLTIFEEPAIAVLSLFPRSDNVHNKQSIWRRFKNYIYTHRRRVILSVKVSSIGETKRKFSVRYVMEDSHKRTKSAETDASDTFIEDMFSAIPDISLSKAAI